MFLAIFIFVLLIILFTVDIEINIKSANDTIKIDAKFGLIRFVIPHQKLISKALKSEQLKNKQKQREDFKKLFKNRHYLNRLFKHSSLSMFYMAKFTKEEVYLNPILNGAYLMVSNQIYAYLKHHFKMVDYRNLKLIYDEHYENIDYFICVKADLISILTAILIRK